MGSTTTVLTTATWLGPFFSVVWRILGLLLRLVSWGFDHSQMKPHGTSLLGNGVVSLWELDLATAQLLKQLLGFRPFFSQQNGGGPVRPFLSLFLCLLGGGGAGVLFFWGGAVLFLGGPPSFFEAASFFFFWGWFKDLVLSLPCFFGVCN